MMLLLPILLLATASAGGGEPGPRRPSELAVEWLRGEVDRFSASLTGAHGALTERARREDPAQLARLTPEPPRPRPRGYGLLPEILPDLPGKPASLGESRFDLHRLTTEYAADLRDAALLALRAGGAPGAPLAPLVEEYLRLVPRLRLLESKVAYHRYWQGAVVEFAAYFAERNRVVALVRELSKLLSVKGDAARIAALRKEIAERASPFNAAPGLSIERRDGERVMPIAIVTDIGDPAFLDAFAAAVQVSFAESEAARALRFRVELSIRRVTPESLYPEGPPERGASIDEKEHLSRFPEGALVLTTGADSTHAWAGHSLHLGADPVRPRVLAHEFAHLLGFTDAYADPARGRVSEGMIRRLLEACGGEEE